MKLDMASHLGARAGRRGEPLEQAEAEYRAEYKPTPQQIARFRTHYIVGQINDRIYYLQSDMRFRSRGELKALLEKVDGLAGEWGYGVEEWMVAPEGESDAL